MKTLFSARRKYGPLAEQLELFLRRANKSRAKANFRKARHRLAVFSFDHIGLMINQFGVYEGDELDLAFDFLSALESDFAKRTALDIGANIGNHAAYFADRFAKVHAFEPNPRTFELLGFNMAEIENVTCHRFGLSDKAGTATIFQDDKNMGASFVGEESERPGRKTKAMKIKLKTLDHLGTDVGDVALIKIDVEGMEAAVLRGGAKFLEKFRPLIFFEIQADDFRDGDCESVAILKRLGYGFCWIESEKPGSLAGAAWSFLKSPFEAPRNRIVTDDVIPQRFHSFVIAVPPTLKATLMAT